MKEKEYFQKGIKMTREEAIDTLKNGLWWDRKQLDEAIDIAVSALRPVSRERVKKVWMGEWEFEQSEFTDAKYGSIRCSRCKKIDAHGDDRVLKNYRKYNHFCPKCGAPMTNEAVQMVMERLEALKDD